MTKNTYENFAFSPSYLEIDVSTYNSFWYRIKQIIRFIFTGKAQFVAWRDDI